MKSVFLPNTTFPVRSCDPNILLDKWSDLYQKLRIKAEKRTVFVLHDGPPYANGMPHIGHALNKILKDAAVRYKQMCGFNAIFVPGWDCHGLPIEWKVIEQKPKDKKECRLMCREFAQKWVNEQRNVFKKMGILADWDNPYLTMDKTSEASIVDCIYSFVKSDKLRVGYKPVLWSTVEKTALAEAEVEYHDKKSDSIYVLFPTDKDFSLLIWTTTPWTIPANLAVCYNKNIDYCLATLENGKKCVLAKELLEQVQKKINILQVDILTEDLGTIRYHHPLHQYGYPKNMPIFHGDHVTIDAGTGLVHTAPDHGLEDFYICKSNGISCLNLISEDGVYMPKTQLFAGENIFKCSVIPKLKESESLVYHEEIIHSYPHSWRSRAPLIYRTTRQFFIDLEDISEVALTQIDNVKWIPEHGYNRIKSFIQTRKEWCISRQRTWGVPIPLFVNKNTDEILQDKELFVSIVEQIKNNGIDIWFDNDSTFFLKGRYTEEQIKAYEKIDDIVDVWFESGCTYNYVLKERLKYFPADMYLEGSDQHRGWFQSSILCSSQTDSQAPYKTVLTHGFICDDKGRKMSKSLGNVVDPIEVVQKFGMDVLRLWVCSRDYHYDIQISNDIIIQVSDMYKKFRNLIRYMLGALCEYSEDEHIKYKDLPDLEKLMLHKMYELITDVRKNMENYNYNLAINLIYKFFSVDLSAFYFDIRKDCLYCDSKENHKRMSYRTVVNIIFTKTIKMIAPFLIGLSEEAWLHYGKTESIHEQEYPVALAEWEDQSLQHYFKDILSARKSVLLALENARINGDIKSSLEAKVKIDAKNVDMQFLTELCIVSECIQEDGLESPVVTKSNNKKCSRCWKYIINNGSEYCERCK